jgi:hypothetical protein
MLPGFIFSSALYNSNEPFYYTPLTHRTVISIFASILFLLIWTPLYLYLPIFHCQVNYGTLLEMIAGKNDQLLQAITFLDLTCFGFYIITIYIFAWITGYIVSYLVKKFKLDAKFKILRLENPWYYLFSGYDWEVGEPDFIIITAAIELAGKGYLYNGYLENFYFDKNGELDRLELTDTRRRNIENDHSSEKHGQKSARSTDDRFYPIDGHNFVLRFSDIKSLNIQFLKIDRKILK